MNWLLFFVGSSVWLFVIWGVFIFCGARRMGLSGWPEYWLSALAVGLLAPLLGFTMLKSGVFAANNLLLDIFVAQARTVILANGADIQNGIAIFGALAGLVYIFVAGVLLIRLFKQVLFLNRLRETGTQLLDAGYEITETDQACPPCSTGLFHPVILMPSTLREQLSNGQRKMIYAHETAHIRHRDPQVMLALYALKALLWPLPPVHDLARRWLDAAEQRADNAALQGADKNLRENYGRLLLEVLRKYSGKALPCPSATLNFKHLRSTKMRVKNIMNESPAKLKPLRLKIQLGIMTGIATLFGSYGLIAAAGETVSPDKDAQPTVRYPPIFPADCTANPGKYAASVIVKFDVDKSGTVENIRVTKSDNPCYNKTTKNSVAKWKYEPVLKDGKPRKRKDVQAMITYRLNNTAQ